MKHTELSTAVGSSHMMMMLHRRGCKVPVLTRRIKDCELMMMRRSRRQSVRRKAVPSMVRPTPMGQDLRVPLGFAQGLRRVGLGS